MAMLEHLPWSDHFGVSYRMKRFFTASRFLLRIRSISVLHILSYQPEAFVQERKRGVAPAGALPAHLASFCPARAPPESLLAP